MRHQQILAAFAGQSYPKSPRTIRTLIRADLENFSPEKTAANSQVLIVPHIDLAINREIYARTYHHLLRVSQFPKIFYILGVGHHCPHEFSATACEFVTPLGSVRSDINSLKAIEQACDFSISRSPATFQGEHSLEFVVIWLQAIRDLYFPGAEFQVVPILMGGMFEMVRSGQLPDANDEVSRFGQAVANSFRQHANGEAMIIASIDGCHVGPRFEHDFPVDAHVLHVVQRWESKLWKLCHSNRLPEFVEYLHRVENGFHFDGVGVLTLLLRNFAISVKREYNAAWHENSDSSVVTFSGGYGFSIGARRYQIAT